MQALHPLFRWQQLLSRTQISPLSQADDTSARYKKTPTTRPDGPFVVGVFIFQTALRCPLQPPFLVDTCAGALVFAARGVEMPGEDEADAARKFITILRIDDILPV